jgi:GC-rich sequence DNA-binding factor
MQIRKGVTGAQLISAQQESVYSQYMIQPFSNSFSNAVANEDKNLTTAELLEQAYSHVNYEFSKKSQKPSKKGKDVKTAGPKSPEEIRNLLYEKLRSSKELNNKHYEDIDNITHQIDSIKIDLFDCEQDGPRAAEKYKFYQEIKCFVSDFVECFDEKVMRF